MKFYGLFGNPLGHTISPAIHKKIYEMAGIEAAYKTYEIKENQLEAALESMKVLNIGGANVTSPFKKKFIPLLDYVSERTARLNSVNTIKNCNGAMEGYNTDYDGIEMTFQLRNWEIEEKDFFIMGTGGASHAMVYFLLDNKAKSITVVSRYPGEYHPDYEIINYEDLTEKSGDYLINCTPVGVYPNINESPVEKEVVANFNRIFDMTYNPPESLLLQYGKELGRETANGMDMLVGQAIRSVEIWEEQVFDDALIENIIHYFRREK